MLGKIELRSKKMKLKLKEIRLDNNLTQAKLADILNIRRNVYSRYECQTRTIPIEVLWKLADFYNVTIDYLVGLEV